MLLAQNHRPRALELLKQFLDVDVRAVMSAMSVGVFPYIARLLSTPSTATPDTLPPLLCIYAKIIALDPSFFSSLEMTKEVYISSFKVSHFSISLFRIRITSVSFCFSPSLSNLMAVYYWQTRSAEFNERMICSVKSVFCCLVAAHPFNVPPPSRC